MRTQIAVTPDKDPLWWREQGKCWGSYRPEWAHDPWFPYESVDSRRGEQTTIDAEIIADQLCRGCTVRDLCLEYAVERIDVYGVWGGTLIHQRKMIRKNRASQQQRIAAGATPRKHIGYAS